MKQRTSWAWTMSALAVLASPMTLDKVVGHFSSEAVYRSIAAEGDPETAPLAGQPLAQPEVVKTDAEKIVIIKTDIAAEKLVAEDLKTKLAAAHAELVAGHEADSSKIQKISEIEKLINDHFTKITGFEEGLKALDGSTSLTGADLSAGKLALADVKKITDELKAALEESNKKIAANAESIRLKAEEERKREEELAASTENLRKREEELAAEKLLSEKLKKEHDIFVCQAEQRDNDFLKKIDELNKQQQQFTQVMLGMNQMLIGMFGQMQNQQRQQPSVYGYGGSNYFGLQQQQPLYGLGQLQLPSQSLMMANPWSQQQQPQTVNNYYGPPQPQMGMGMMNPLGMSGQPQQSFLPYQQSNFGFAPLVDDSTRGVFGNFQTMAPPQQMPMPGFQG
jgi:hypothetical protein